MKSLLLATRNKGKKAEFFELLKGVPYLLKTLDDIKFNSEIEETGSSFEENAILKAKIVGKKVGLLTLGEDSGLEIDALGGEPGIYSARFIKGTDQDKIDAILERMDGIPQELRSARYKACVALYDPDKKTVFTFDGISEGYITTGNAGDQGFGYDPIFMSKDLGKTFGQASRDEKNAISHRARALNKLKTVLMESAS